MEANEKITGSEDVQTLHPEKETFFFCQKRHHQVTDLSEADCTFNDNETRGFSAPAHGKSHSDCVEKQNRK